MPYTEELKQNIEAYIEENRQAALEFLETLVNLEGKDGEEAQLRQTAAFLQEQFANAGLETSLVETGGGHAPVVTGVLNSDVPGRELIFTGHYDTVFPAGSWGPSPFRIESGKAFGPGVCDMKGGITIAFFVVKALKKLGFRECPVRLLFVGDEEGDRSGGRTVEILREHARNALAAFNMENGYESGEVCIGRKGVCEYKVTVTGVAAHPGHAYDAGRNAIEEMAHKVIGLQGCTPKNPDREYSVSVGTIQGGIGTNSVPAHCEARVDVRMTSRKALEECDEKMRKVCSRTVIDGTSTTLEQMDMLIPFETTEAVRSAYETLKTISDETTRTITGSIVVGGASDASYFAEQGAKIVCQCGIRGAFTHSRQEYAVIESIYDGIRLFTWTALNWQRFLQDAI